MALSRSTETETPAPPLITVDADLKEYPLLDWENSISPDTQLSVGDLHANALKLIYFLIRQRVLSMPESHYNELVDIYLTLVDYLSSEQLERFNTILSSTKIINTPTIRLIGDELADRGMNDYFVLKVIKRLKNDDTPVGLEILLSNHGLEYLESSEYRRKKLKPPRFSKQHAKSLFNLQTLIDRGLVQRSEIDSITTKYYKPALRLLSYTLNEDKTGITIYSHAGIGLETINALMEKFNIFRPTDAMNAEQFALIIESINDKFTDYVRSGTAHTLFSDTILRSCYARPLKEFLPDYPIEFLLWNRRYDNLHRPEEYSGFNLHFVHGHDSTESTHKNVIVLDNILGKSTLSFKGKEFILYSHESQLTLKRIAGLRAIERENKDKKQTGLLIKTPSFVFFKEQQKPKQNVSTSSMLSEILNIFNNSF